MNDEVAALVAHLRALDDEPVSAHPEALEDIHRGLVAQLEALAGAGARTDRRI